MITKKCLVSFIICGISLLLAFAAVHFMSLFTVSKWLGVTVGGSALCISLVLYFVLRKKLRVLPYCIIFIASIATGITISSLFVYVGGYPSIRQTAVLYACFMAAFLLYCLLMYLPFCRKHCVIALWLYAIALFVTGILLLVFLKWKIFILALIGLITLIAFLISLPLDAYDEKDHVHHLVYCSFGFLIITIVVVLIVLSQGEGLDGFDFGGGGSGGGFATTKRKKSREPLYKEWNG